MEFNNNRIYLTEDENGVVIKEENFIVYEGRKYYLNHLNPSFKASKGGNSSVFLLNDEEEPERELVIKICTTSKPNRHSNKGIIRRHGRFIKEIEVLNKLKDQGKQNIVKIEFDDILNIGYRVFPFYVMEKAKTDLKDYLLSSTEIDLQEKFRFCLDIFQAIRDLQDEGFYHRDIKPDNILLFNDESSDDNSKMIWKLGDLGLIAERDKDYDDLGEKIGPFGWLSPEAMNKYLTEKAGIGHDCLIDGQSDIFQLGKLFWFIFKLNVPIGQVEESDFSGGIFLENRLFTLINGMLQYSKNRRYDIKKVFGELEIMKLEFGV